MDMEAPVWVLNPWNSAQLETFAREPVMPALQWRQETVITVAWTLSTKREETLREDEWQGSLFLANDDRDG